MKGALAFIQTKHIKTKQTFVKESTKNWHKERIKGGRKEDFSRLNRIKVLNIQQRKCILLACDTLTKSPHNITCSICHLSSTVINSSRNARIKKKCTLHYTKCIDITVGLCQ